MQKNTIPFCSDELYAQVTAAFPIVCVDVIPFNAKTNKIGVITRATGKERGKRALIGGRIGKGETIPQAITRHLGTDLNIEKFEFYAGNAAEHPFYVMQYAHESQKTSDFPGYDPSKQSIGLTYVITITGTPSPTAEAAAFDWISESEIPQVTAYNQGLAMRQVFNFVRSASA